MTSRDQLILGHLHLVKVIAMRVRRKFHIETIEVDDLIQAGCIGLIQSAEKYDLSLGIKFGTYAGYRIYGSIVDDLRENNYIPRSVYEKAKMIGEIESLLKAIGKPASRKEISRISGISEMEIDRVSFINNFMNVSIDDVDKFHQAERKSLLNISLRKPNSLGIIIRKELRAILKANIEKLPVREKICVNLYFFEGLSLKEIAHQMRFSESRASQLIKGGLGRLKTLLAKKTEGYL